MGDATRIYLGKTFSCVIGGDAWYLVERGPGDLVLEGRFEDDRGALGPPLDQYPLLHRTQRVGVRVRAAVDATTSCRPTRGIPVRARVSVGSSPNGGREARGKREDA